MHAYLVTGGSSEERTSWVENFFKTQGIAEVIRIGHPMKSHLIKTVRELTRSLNFSPSDSQKGRGVLLEDAHLLTLEAANSFLKTLEEPIGNTFLLLTAPNSESVLPTILSRAMHVDLGTSRLTIDDDKKREAQATFSKLLKAGVGERLEFIEKIGKRDEALLFCILQIFAVRETLRNKVNGQGEPLSTKELAALATRLEQTRQDIEANVNVKLALAELLLHYP